MESSTSRGPFYCDVCDCEVKDSATFRDHINGKDHNKKLGINLKDFKDSSFEEVKAMLQKKIRERQEKLDNLFKSSSVTIPGERAYNEEFADEKEEGDEDE